MTVCSFIFSIDCFNFNHFQMYQNVRDILKQLQIISIVDKALPPALSAVKAYQGYCNGQDATVNQQRSCWHVEVSDNGPLHSSLWLENRCTMWANDPDIIGSLSGRDSQLTTVRSAIDEKSLYILNTFFHWCAPRAHNLYCSYSPYFSCTDNFFNTSSFLNN